MKLHAITKYLLETGRPWHKTVKMAFPFIIMNWKTVDVGLVGYLAAVLPLKKIKDHAESTRLKEEKKIAAASSKAMEKKDEQEIQKKKEH